MVFGGGSLDIMIKIRLQNDMLTVRDQELAIFTTKPIFLGTPIAKNVLENDHGNAFSVYIKEPLESIKPNLIKNFIGLPYQEGSLLTTKFVIFDLITLEFLINKLENIQKVFIYKGQPNNPSIITENTEIFETNIGLFLDSNQQRGLNHNSSSGKFYTKLIPSNSPLGIYFLKHQHGHIIELEIASEFLVEVADKLEHSDLSNLFVTESSTKNTLIIRTTVVIPSYFHLLYYIELLSKHLSGVGTIHNWKIIDML